MTSVVAENSPRHSRNFSRIFSGKLTSEEQLRSQATFRLSREGRILDTANEPDLCNRAPITGEACASYLGIAVRDFIARLARCQLLPPDIAGADLDTLARKFSEFVPSDALWIGDDPNSVLSLLKTPNTQN